MILSQIMFKMCHVDLIEDREENLDWELAQLQLRFDDFEKELSTTKPACQSAELKREVAAVFLAWRACSVQHS